MYCPNCETQAQPEQKFCRSCGDRLSVRPESESARGFPGPGRLCGPSQASLEVVDNKEAMAASGESATALRVGSEIVRLGAIGLGVAIALATAFGIVSVWLFLLASAIIGAGVAVLTCHMVRSSTHSVPYSMRCGNDKQPAQDQLQLKR